MDELILKQRKLKEDIIKRIGEAELSAFMITPILKDLYEQMVVIEEKEYQQAQYNAQQREEQEKQEEEEEDGKLQKSTEPGNTTRC